jgi:hypothetical protein
MGTIPRRLGTIPNHLGNHAKPFRNVGKPFRNVEKPFGSRPKPFGRHPKRNGNHPKPFGKRRGTAEGRPEMPRLPQEMAENRLKPAKERHWKVEPRRGEAKWFQGRFWASCLKEERRRAEQPTRRAPSFPCDKTPLALSAGEFTRPARTLGYPPPRTRSSPNQFWKQTLHH